MAESTNVLIIGGGGREHALGWKLKQSRRCGKLYFAPGNGGTSAIGENVQLTVTPVNTKNADAIDWFCRQNGVGLIIIGPEDPLAEGLVDRLEREGRYVFGPTAAGAKIEADKAYAKQLMRSVAVPTADSRTFTDFTSAERYVRNHETPVVVKATGLAAGKGAIVCDDDDEAVAALRRCLIDKEFGEAGETVVVEERLVGQEVSVFALVDGANLYVLDPCQDHKPVHEGDLGPNTGGMGAYCPTPLVDDETMRAIESQILVPTVDALHREGVEYRGVLYAGLMLTAGGPKVIEFNCRFGDPETQPLMVRLKGDLTELLMATCEAQGPRQRARTGKRPGRDRAAHAPRLDEVQIDWDPRTCVCVAMVSGGYPGAYEKGKPITGIEDAETDPDVTVFHAGTTRRKDGTLVTAGGRVLNVCALGSDLKEAQQKANAACEKIHFEGAHFRRDIGSRVMTP